jgi:monovalent cation:H+ antiporter-2, CPA2 family
MIAIFILLAAAAVGFGISRWLRLPAIPLLLVAGLGTSLLGIIPPDEILQQTLVLGLTFLVFVAGIELNPRRVGAQKRAALKVGIAQFLLLGLAGGGVAWAMGLTAADGALPGAGDHRQLDAGGRPPPPAAPAALRAVRAAGDRRPPAAGPAGHPADPAPRARPGREFGAMAAGLGAALLLVLLAYVCLRWVTPFIVLRLKPDEEHLLLTVLALLFVFIGLAELMDLPVVAGAFLAGVSLSGFPVSGVIRGQLSSLSDFFLAIFFTAFGALLTLPTANELATAHPAHRAGRAS